MESGETVVFLICGGIGLLISLIAGIEDSQEGCGFIIFAMALFGFFGLVIALIIALLAGLPPFVRTPAPASVATVQAQTPVAENQESTADPSTSATNPVVSDGVTKETYQVISILDKTMPGGFLNATEIVSGESVGYLVSYYELGSKVPKRNVLMSKENFFVSCVESGTVDPVIVKRFNSNSNETSVTIIVPKGTVSWHKNPR